MNHFLIVVADVLLAWLAARQFQLSRPGYRLKKRLRELGIEV